MSPPPAMGSVSCWPPTKGQPAFSGERVFFTGRLDCLSRPEAEALVRRLGGSVERRLTHEATLVILGEGGDADARGSGRPAAAGPPPAGVEPRLLTEREFCERAGIPPGEELRARYHSLSAIRARYPELREDRIRYLESWGLAHPAHVTDADSYYTFDSLALLASVHRRLAAGVSLRAIVRDLVAEREGQLSLDFGPRSSGATVLPLRSRRTAGEAEEWFREGYELERRPDGEEAAFRAYSRALERDPDLVPALINLANLYYRRDDDERARAFYLRAAELGADEYFQIPFNLGNLAHDREDYAEARRLYERALELAPDYADAHLYLALTLEKLSLSGQARPHWRAYCTLDPTGEWAALAREMERTD